MCATSTTSASGAASSAARNPPGRGASTLVICSARGGHPLAGRACAAGRWPGPAALGVKLPPSGKITNASFVVEAGGQRRDLRLEVLARARVRAR